MKSFNDYLKEAALSAKQKKIAKIAGDKDKIDAHDLAALRSGKKPVEEASCSDKDMKKEELVGNQHKLDKNKNGKLDAHDFKLLRKEEAEQIDELSKKTLGSYVNKAAKDSRIHGQIATDFENTADKARKQSKKDSFERLNRKYLEKSWKREDGIAKAVNKLTKEEVELDEGRMKDIYTDMMDHATKKGYSSHKQFTPADYETVGKQHGISGKELAIVAGHKTAHQADTHFKKPVQPGKGMDRARALAQRGMQSLSKEEVERIEEKLTQMDETVYTPPKPVDRERDELKNFRGYKKNAGKHTADVSSNIKDMHPKTAQDKHPVPAHSANDKKAAHKAYNNPFASAYHGKDNQLGAHIKPDNTPAPRSVNDKDKHKPSNRKPIKDFKEEVEQIDEAIPKNGWKVDKQLTANMDAPEHKDNKAYTTSASAQHSAFIHKSHDDDKWHVQIGTSDGKNHYKAFDSYEKAKAHLHSKTGIKEEVSAEQSPYLKATLQVMDEGKIDDLRDAQKLRASEKSAYDKDFKADTSHPSVTVHKGTAYGGSAQKDDETDEKPETKEKRGPGRPSGTSTGARLKGSKKEKDDIDGREYSLHLPK